nr:DNA cytosine methyltransferase [Burkholderia multivorans]
MAGWEDSRPVWTGSCPCQPFSAAGKGAGFDDERHLWPAWYWLIGECRPPIIFGEQVASKDIDPWIDLVQANLEAVDYAVGCVPFPSAGVGAPHIRDRAYWMADANGMRSRRNAGAVRRTQAQGDREGFEDGRQLDRSRASGATRRLADADGRECDGLAVVRGIELDRADAGRPQGGCEPESRRAVRGLGEPHNRRRESAGLPAQRRDRHDQSGAEWNGEAGEHAAASADGRSGAEFAAVAPGPTNGFWRDADWLLCRDEKWRPVEPGTFPLADGAPSRVGRLRAYGNAINAEAATQFILAARDILTN